MILHDDTLHTTAHGVPYVSVGTIATLVSSCFFYFWRAMFPYPICDIGKSGFVSLGKNVPGISVQQLHELFTLVSHSTKWSSGASRLQPPSSWTKLVPPEGA